MPQADPGPIMIQMPTNETPPSATPTGTRNSNSTIRAASATPLSVRSSIGAFAPAALGGKLFVKLGVGAAVQDRIVAVEQRSEEQRLNSSHVKISYAVFCLKKKTPKRNVYRT